MQFSAKIPLIFLLFLLPVITPAQSSRFSGTVTAGVGEGVPAGGYLTNQFEKGPTVAGDFEFRLLKHLSAEIGVENMLPIYDSYGSYGVTKVRERLTLLPFGLRGVLPEAKGRLELFAGIGGAYLWPSSDAYYNSYGDHKLVQANAGGRFALDRGRHFWLGTTVRFYRDLGRPTQEWVSVTGDFGFRLGR